MAHETPKNDLRSITYTPPTTTDGWSIQDEAGHVLLATDVPPSSAILALIDAALSLNKKPGTEPASSRSAIPTPADVAENHLTRVDPSRQYRPIRKAAEWMERNGIDRDRVLTIINEPTATRPSGNGSTIYTGPGYEVVVGNDDQSILSVRPLVPIGQFAPEKRKHRGPTGSTRPRLPDTVPAFIRLLRSQGYEVTAANSGHYHVTHGNHPGAFAVIPNTPSDHRWAENTARNLRRAFGVDPRDAAPRS